MTDLEKMMQFWRKRHLALFGFSRNPARVSRQVYDLLISNGYNIYPINPNASEIDSIKCYRSLDEIQQELEGAIIITNPEISLEVVKQCHQRGIKEFWFQLNTMDDAVREYLNRNGLGYFYNCILMNPHLLMSTSSIERST